MKRVITLATAIAFVSSAVFADEKSDKKAFREAYKAYQEAEASGNRAAALVSAQKAFEFGEKVFGPDHSNTAALLLNYGRLIYRHEEAREVLEDAVNRYEKLYGKDAQELIDPLMDLAANSTRVGTLGGAKRIYRRALNLASQHYPGNTMMEGTIRLEMGKVALQEAYSREALKHLKKARELLASVEGNRALAQIADADFYIGKYQMTKKDFDEAEDSLLRSLEVFETYAPNSRITMTNHAFLIRVYEEQGLSDEATKHCRAIGAKTPANPDQDYIPVYRKHPIYPLSAQRAGKEGYAIIELTVDENGFVKDPKVIERDGPSSFETASLDAVRSFRYAPRYENGKPVDSKGVRYRFTYGLSN